QDFKTCADSSFCRRARGYADNVLANPSFVSPYLLVKETIVIKDGILSGDIINKENKILFTFEVSFLEIGTARIRINEKHPLKPRYDNVKNFALVKEPSTTLEYTEHPSQDGLTSISFGKDRKQKIVVYHSPFRVEFLVDDVPTILLNDRGFFNFEHMRKKESSPALVDQNDQASKVDGDTEEKEGKEEGLWEETFNGRTDTKPNGPESIGLDISFPGFAHVYGIPEHASTFSLKETRGGDGAYKEPYRLYNLDVFEYDLDNPMALYGSIPFMMAHRRGATAAVLWLNAAETWIDITKNKEDKHGLSKFLNFGKSAPTSTHTHWFSESGIVDVFVFLGPSSSDIFHQYGLLTGFTALPQYFAISYHQCRWNYLDQNDVIEVDEGFDKHEIPYDVIWLDIEHTDGKRYMTWDNVKFPDPVGMQNSIGQKGRKMVTIVDPHLKRDDNYYVYKEASDLDLFTKEPDGRVYDGWCWPGSSSWPDFTNPSTREWWSKKIAFDQYKGSTGFLFVWNDMNEPSVFNGPEITMPKDIIHHGGWEHRDLHNIYGLLFHASTAVGLSNRKIPSSRPFVLSRAFFAG
ncbi:13794_t:CDS:1, partial [Acaulospora colombiana]